MRTPLRRYLRGHTLVTMDDVQAGQSRVYHFDHQGTTQCLTDSTGAVTDRFASDAWGVEVKRTGSSINRQWYVGRSGYYRGLSEYIRARWYDLRRGQWLSKDPEFTGRVYGYSGANPGGRIDPSGNVDCCCCCAESLINVGLWFFYYPPKKGTGLFPINTAGQIGWMIAIEANMDHSINKKVAGHSQCALTWLERTNTPPGKGLPANEWYDAFARIPNSPVFTCWQNRKSICPGKECVYLYDPPRDAIHLGRPIDASTSIVVTLRSADHPECKCVPPLQQLWFDVHTVVDARGNVDWKRTGIWKDGSRQTGARNIGEPGVDSIIKWITDPAVQAQWCSTLPDL